MCGIIASLNCKDSNKILLEGLEQLQNRGYDSCGISILKDNNFHIQKYASTEKELSLKKLKENINLPKSNLALAHTRWATHGEKSDNNAHPHIDFFKKVCLVHNGIITNYIELKKKLSIAGYKFYGETDTEIICNLISYHINNNKNELFINIKNALAELEGTWGLVIMIKDCNSLFISKSGSPLLLGKTKNGILIASEISAFCNRCIDIVKLDEGELLEINETNILTKGDHIPIGNFFKKREIVDLENHTIIKNCYPFKHWMIKEITEQPLAILRTLNYGGRINNNNICLGGLQEYRNLIENKKHIIILGCGTSLNSGLWISHILKENNIFNSVNVIDASEFEIYEITNPEETIIVVLSQSGETKDIHRCIEKINKNIPILGIVNSVGSLIARDTLCGIYLNAGREVSVASTKSFICQQVALLLLCLWYSKKNIFNLCVIEDLKSLPNFINEAIYSMELYKKIAIYLCDHKSCFLLGKNTCYPIAREASLKLKEIGYIHAEAFYGGALKHGPFSMIEKGTPIVLFILDDIYKKFMLSTLEEVKSRGAKTIVVTNIDLNYEVDYLIKLPKLNILSSIPFIIPFQIIAYEMALIKGHNPDYPRNLAKVVTVD